MIKVNLLPKEVTRKLGYRQQLITFGLAAFIILAAVLYTWFYLNSIIKEKEEIITQKQEQLNELKKIEDLVETYKKRKDFLKAKLNTIDTLKKQQTGPVRILDDVCRAIPNLIWLTLLEESDQEVELDGFAFSQIGIADLMMNLEGRPTFKESILKVSEQKSLPEGNVYAFKISCLRDLPVIEEEENEPAKETSSNSAEKEKASTEKDEQR